MIRPLDPSKSLLLSEHVQEMPSNSMKFEKFKVAHKNVYNKASKANLNPVALKKGISPQMKALGQVLIQKPKEQGLRNDAILQKMGSVRSHID